MPNSVNNKGFELKKALASKAAPRVGNNKAHVTFASPPTQQQLRLLLDQIASMKRDAPTI
jgi:hypothetical protein